MSFQYNRTASEGLKQGGFDFLILDELHYIKVGDSTVSQLKKAGILPDLSYSGLTRNKPDGLILCGKNTVKVLVEYKNDGVFASLEDGRREIHSWYFPLAEKLGCNVVCASDGTKTYWFHRNGNIIKDEDGNPLSAVLDVAKITGQTIQDEERFYLSDLIRRFDDLDDSAQLRVVKPLDPQALAKSVWQKIWINTGKEPEKCLYNVVEMFIFKFLSDLGILKDDLCFEHIYTLSKNKSNVALDRYATNVRPAIRTMFPRSPIDNTTVINGTIFVNEEGLPNFNHAALFNDVLETFHKYGEEHGSFKKIDKNFKTRLYENFLRQSAGISALGQYFTPRSVVKAMVKMAAPDTLSDHACIADPFCGVGGFLLELLNETPKLKNLYRPHNGKITPSVTLIGYDKGSDEKDDQRTIILAKANMLIYFSDFISQYSGCMKEFSDKVFNSVFHLIKNNLGTFGITDHEDQFDLILTNPPYVTSGVSSIKEQLKDSGKMFMYPSNGNGLEGLALEWIIRALKPGGKAFVVVPDGILSRQSDKKLRDKILSSCELNAIISLPPRTFFATPKKTYILSITKKANSIVQKSPVFTYLVSEIGETRDANRFDLPQNDLLDMTISYLQFFATPNNYMSSNPRVKIQPVSRFINAYWLIDKDWNEEEKCILGISDDNFEISEQDFFDHVRAMKSYMSSIATVQENPIEVNKTRSIYLTDDDFEILSSGIGKNKEFFQHFQEPKKSYIPVYTAAQKPVAFIPIAENKRPIMASLDNPVLSFATNGDGSAGKNFVFHTEPFYINMDRIAISCKHENVSLEYVMCNLQNMKIQYGFNHNFKANRKNIKDVEIKIPVDSSGNFDIQKQQMIAERYLYLDSIRKKVNELYSAIDAPVKQFIDTL